MLRSLQSLTPIRSGVLITLSALLVTYSSTSALTHRSVVEHSQILAQGDSIATLSDGDYQFCSNPDPMDWRGGAGVCFRFIKTGQNIEGYYGYPNSDNFACLRGSVKTHHIQGEGLVLSWPGLTWFKVPNAEFNWDVEGHLKLHQGKIVRSIGEGSERMDWIQFHQMDLDISHFHRYRLPKMTSPSKLCDWKTIH